MKNDSRFFWHVSALVTLFVLGNSIIILPLGNVNEFTFLAFLFSLFCGLVFYFPWSFSVEKIFNHTTENFILKLLQVLILTSVTVFSIWCGADTLLCFLQFVGKVILPETPFLFTTITFLLVIALFLTKSQVSVLKFFLVAILGVSAIILFFFVATSFNFTFRNVFLFRLPKPENLFEQAYPYLLNAALPTLILPFYNILTFKKTKFKATVSGLFCGYLLLGFCVIGTVLLFGADFAGSLDFPYSAAASTVSFGRLFTRLDGFSYFVYFICALAKITVCLHTTFLSLKKLNSILNNAKIKTL